MLRRRHRQRQVHETVIRRRRLPPHGKSKVTSTMSNTRMGERATTYLMTSHTLHPIPELPLEKVNNYAIVPHPIYPPLLLARDLLRQFLELGLPLRRHLVRRLRYDAVQVLVQCVEEPREEFLRVVLFGSGEL